MRYRFQQWTLEPESFRLSGPEGPVDVEPRVFDLLTYLVRHHRRVVPREELLAEVWQGEHVTPASLDRAISELRRVLGDDPRRAELVETVRGRGYGFVAPVDTEPSPADGDLDGDGGEHGRRRRRLRAVAGIAVVAVFLLLLTRHQAPEGTTPEPGRGAGTVALLPWANATGDPSLDWLELGLMDMVATGLRDRAALDVLPASRLLSALERRETGEEPTDSAANGAAAGTGITRRLARELGFHWLLSATVFLDDGIYRIRATLQSVEGTPRSRMVFGSDLFAAARETEHWILDTLADESEPRWVFSSDPVANERYARGREAELKGRMREAEVHFRSALDRDPRMLRARYELALVHRILGRYEESRDAALDLLEEARAAGDVDLELGLLNHLGLVAWSRGDPASGLPYLEEAAETARRNGHRRILASALNNVGILHAGSGRWDEAEALYREALAIHADLSNRRGQASVYNSLGVLAWRRGRVEESGRWHQRALELRREIGEARYEAASLNNLGSVALALGDLERAEERFLQSLRLRRELGDRRGETSSWRNLGRVRLDLGDLAGAKQALDEARGLAEEREDRRLEAAICALESRLALYEGRAAEALDKRRRSVELYVAVSDPASEASARLELARSWIDAGELARAGAEIDEARALEAEVESGGLRSAIERVAAALHEARGDPARARKELELSLREAEAAGSLGAEVEARLALADFLRRNTSDAAELAAAERLLAPLPAGWKESYPYLILRSRLAAGTGDRRHALEWAEAARRTAGERWSEEDETYRRGLGRDAPIRPAS